jgi:hypothetical protein
MDAATRPEQVSCQCAGKIVEKLWKILLRKISASQANLENKEQNECESDTKG